MPSVSELLKKDILFLYGPAHELAWGRAQNLARELSRRTRVLYVEAPFSYGVLSNLAKRIRAPRWETVSANLIIHRPPTLPLNRFWVIRHINAALQRHFILRGLARFKLQPGLVWFYEHYGSLLAGKMPGDVQVCDFAAPPRHIPGLISRRHLPSLLRQHHSLAKASDIVFAETERYSSELVPFNPNTFTLPSGVNVDLFETAKLESTPIPPQIERIPRPRLGFAGSVRSWVDLDTLTFTAQRHPEWSFVFIGPVAVDTSKLKALPSVHFLGEKPYGELPRYLKGMDVLLLPYRRCQETDYSDTPKILQYLAVGKPVVCLSFATSDRFRDLTIVAKTRQEFEAGIARCLQGGWTPDVQAIQRRLSERTWSRVVDQALERIERVLTERREPR